MSRQNDSRDSKRARKTALDVTTPLWDGSKWTFAHVVVLSWDHRLSRYKILTCPEHGRGSIEYRRKSDLIIPYVKKDWR